MNEMHDPQMNMPPNWDNPYESSNDSFGNMRRSVSEVLRVLTVRKWVFLIPFCLATSAAFVMSLYVPRRYVAKTVFERRDDPVLVNLPRSEGTGAFVAFRRTLANDVANVQSLTEMIEEPSLLDQLKTRFDANLTEPRQWAEVVSGGIDVSFLHQSPNHDMIELRLTMGDPRAAKLLLDQVRDHYIDTTQARIGNLLGETKAYFEEEAAQRQAVVEQLQDDLLAFQQQHHGLNPLHPTFSFAQLDNLRTDLTSLKRKQSEMETRLEARRDALPSLPVAQPKSSGFTANVGTDLGIETAIRSSESLRLARELQGVWDDIDDLKSSRGMTDRHPEIQSLRRKADRLMVSIEQQDIADEQRAAANRVLQLPMMPMSPQSTAANMNNSAAVEVEILEKLVASNQEEIDRVQARIGELEKVQQEAFRRRKEFSTRQAQVERARHDLSLYRSYADQIGRVLQADASSRGILFEKIKPARCSYIPVSPRLTTVLLLALVTGGGLGTVMVLLSELFDRTIRTRNQVIEGLGLPILESIDVIMTTAARRKQALKKYILVPSASLILAVSVGTSGSLAYLSLHEKGLYEKAVAMPRAVFARVSDLIRPSTIAQVSSSSGQHRTNEETSP